MESQDPIDAALVPALKRSGDIRPTLTTLPALPKLSPLLRPNVRAFPSIAHLPISQD